MRPRDAADAAAAVEVLLRKEAGAEVRRCASATLTGLGLDEYTLLAEAREATKPRGKPGPLRKDAAPPGAISVRAPMDGGAVLALEMSPAEATSLVNAVYDAIDGRRSA